MTIGVIGGTGTIGSEIVSLLAADGEEVRILTRTAPASMAPGVTHSPIDLSDGSGLEAGLAGLDTLIDVGNTSKSPKKTLVEGTRRILDACEKQGVGHYAGISIIGIQPVRIGYYEAKLAQEEVIRNAPVGWSLLMASQFHELLDMVFTAAGKRGITPSLAIPVQPHAAVEAAKVMVGIAQAPPSGESEPLVGPEVRTVAELGKEWKAARGKRTLNLPVPLIGKAAGALKSGCLTRPDIKGPGPTFSEWLKPDRG